MNFMKVAFRFADDLQIPAGGGSGGCLGDGLPTRGRRGPAVTSGHQLESCPCSRLASSKAAPGLVP